MKRIILVILALLIITGAGGATWFYFMQPPPHKIISGADDSNVRSVVAEFGTKLQMVSLQATGAPRKTAMDAAYAPYVAPELLSLWYPEGSSALGRETSSPWPDHIDIVDSHPAGDMYVVEGNVIEMANGTASTSTSSAVAVYPVTLELQSIDNHWLITKVTKGARSELPQVQMISGTLLCLKQKDPSAPKLEGCSYGIATLQGSSTYAVSTSTMSTSTPAFKLGTKVRVTGLVTPANQLDSIPQYQFDGIISATEIQKI